MANQKTLNTLAKGAGIVTIGMVLSKFITYAYRAVIARYLGPEAYGQLALGLTVLGISSIITMIGMPEGLKKFIPEAKNHKEERSYVLSAFLLTIPISIIVTTLIFVSSGFIATEVFNTNSPESLKSIIQILAFVPIFNALSNVSTATTQAKKFAKYRVITNQIFQNIVQLATTIIFISLGYGILGAAIGWLLGAVLSSFLAFYYLEKKAVSVLTLKGYIPKNREMLKFSLPLLMTGVMGTILGWTDTFFIGYFMNDSQVGFYNAALPTAAIMLIPLQALGALALPSLSEESQKSRKEVSSVLKTLTRWTITVTFPAFILMALFSKEMLRLLFGTQYTVAASSLIILSVGYLFNTSTGHLGEVVKTYSRTDLLFKNTVAKFVINIPLNIFLIPKFGIIGAAGATSLSMILVNSLLVLEVHYFLNINPFSRDMLKPVIATLAPISIVYAINKSIFEIVPLWALIPAFAIFGILYLLNLIILNGIKEEDRSIIIGTGRKIDKEKEFEKLADKII
jgi:O-antigen/teichoic acid export membrane protein